MRIAVEIICQLVNGFALPNIKSDTKMLETSICKDFFSGTWLN